MTTLRYFGPVKTARWHSVFVWWCLVLGLMWAWDVPSTLQLPPRSIHQWRQADALSQTLNYYEGGMHFWELAIHLQHGTGGKGAGEFPVLYYVNAWVWHAAGTPLPWTLRWTNALIWLAGLTALRWLIRKMTGSGLLGTTVAAFVFVSPLSAYYGPNYLVNISALAFVFLGWAAAYCWSTASPTRPSRPFRPYWLAACAALSLAILLRPTMAIGLIPLGWPFLAAIARRPHPWGPRLATLPGALLLAIPLLLGAAWVLWAQAYNAASGSVYFLTTTRPLWATPDPGAVWHTFRTLRLPEVYHGYTLLTLLLAAPALALVARLRPRTAAPPSAPAPQTTPPSAHPGPSALLTALALLAYFALWFKNFREHDYYLIEVHLLTPWAMMILVPGLASQQAGRWLVACVFAGQTLHTTATSSLKLDPTPPTWIRPIVGNWAWHDAARFQAHHARYLEPLERLQPELESLGVGRNDWVLSLPDPSPNITLTMLRRKGFTGLYEDHLQAGARAQWAADQGARFLVINRPEILDSGDWGRALDHPVAERGETLIFDIGHLAAPRSASPR